MTRSIALSYVPTTRLCNTSLSFLRGVLGVRAAPPNVTVLAEAGCYPLHVFAAKMLLKYWNRLVCMEDDRLVKRAFVASAALAGTTQGLSCDLAAPAVVDAEKGASSLQSAYLSSVTDSESSKVQQYLPMRDDVAPETYDMAPYLRAGAGRRQRRCLAQLRAGSYWLAVESGRREGMALPRDQRVCQR